MKNNIHLIITVGLLVFTFSMDLKAQKRPPCPPNLILTSPTNDIAIGIVKYEVQSFIQASNKVLVGADVKYDATTYVSLKPGFHAQNGSVFNAYIDGCGGLRFEDETDTKTSAEVEIVNTFPQSKTLVETGQQLGIKALKNYPNPFSQITTIAYELTENTNVSLQIYDVTGKYTTQLFNDQPQQAGTHTILFDRNNFPDGIYYCQLKTGNALLTTKMVLANH